MNFFCHCTFPASIFDDAPGDTERAIDNKLLDAILNANNLSILCSGDASGLCVLAAFGVFTVRCTLQSRSAINEVYRLAA